MTEAHVVPVVGTLVAVGAIVLVLIVGRRASRPAPVVTPPRAGPAPEARSYSARGAELRPSAGDALRSVKAFSTPSRDAAGAGPSSSLVLDALQVGVIVLDERDSIVLANTAATRMGLVLPAGVLGSSAVRTLVGQVRRTGAPREVDLDLPTPAAGDRRDWLGVRVRVTPMNGEVVIEVTDATDAQRLARVRRDFVANVSHELKTPVGALQLLSEALLDASDDPEAAKRFADRIMHESTRLGRLVSELLELSRLQGAEPLPELVPVDVGRVLAEVLDRTRTAAAARSIEIRVGDVDGVSVVGSESQLITALANLVDNAIAYSPEGTTVSIGVSGAGSGGGREAGAGSGGGREAGAGEGVAISVRDEGMGIDPDDLDRIFERFYRADPARSRATGGTGLGLAIVKHIATNHGGEVTVSSTPGRGSTFTLRLPKGQS